MRRPWPGIGGPGGECFLSTLGRRRADMGQLAVFVSSGF
jgi:hypothetical protein